ncbi:MAG: hypothetical protein K2J13_02570, partial [Clostridia bacterium]|nr:hypothetical protein [Clostridia bacterium]
NPLDDNAQLEAGKSYKVKAIFLDDNAKNYEFVTEDGQAILGEVAEAENLEKSFTITASNSGGSLGGVNGENPPATGFDFNKIGELFKEYWQLIASVISIILMLIFITKTIGYENKRKQNKKTIDKKYSTFYGITLFGLTTMTWTLIACVLMGGALLTFIIMLVAKSKYKKSNEEVEDAKSEYEQAKEKKKEDEMRMMLMGMMGGNSSGGQGFAFQQGVSADEMRLMLNDAVNNMLPNVTQYLPQEASYNDELIQQLIDQNTQNEEHIRQLTEQNEMVMRNLAQEQEMLMQRFEEQSQANVNEEVMEKLVEKLSKQQAVALEAEREVAAVNANDEIIKSLIEGQKAIMEKLSQQDDDKKTIKVVEKHSKDEKIEMLMRNKEMLMRQIKHMSRSNNEKQVDI